MSVVQPAYVRVDLQIRIDPTTGESIVFDPRSNRYLRLNATSTRLFNLLRGGNTNSLKLSVKQARQLASFRERLRELGLLEGTSPIVHTQQRRPFLLRLLFRKVYSFPGDKALATVTPRFRWCFSRAFAVIAAIVPMIATALAVMNRSRLVRDWKELRSLPIGKRILLLSVPTVALGAIHELAHGIACKHYGGRVGEMGVGVIALAPSFYCDITDSWMFPARRDRIFVSLAGPWVTALIGGVAAFIWRYIPLAWIRRLSFATFLASASNTLVSLNPFVPSDVYYILSDALDAPNLSRRSFAALRHVVSLRASPPRTHPQQQRKLVAYSLFSLLFWGAIGLGAIIRLVRVLHRIVKSRFFPSG